MNSPVSDIASEPYAPAVSVLNADIPRRHVDFDLKESPVQLEYKDNPFMTLFMGSLSALFPAGETFFVESVRHFRDQITDPSLLKDAQAFIGQEALHSQQHDLLNHFYSRNGIDVKTLEARAESVFNLLRRVSTWKMQLAITTCSEHFTFLFAERLLSDPSLQEKMLAPQVKQVWLWHVLEETEHKAVAFDVYKAAGGSNAMRILLMPIVSLLFVGMLVVFQNKLLRQDKHKLSFKQKLAGFNYFIGPKGLFMKIAPQYFAFFKPSFHPNEHDTVALVAKWRERLFGADGEALSCLKKVV